MCIFLPEMIKDDNISTDIHVKIQHFEIKWQVAIDNGLVDKAWSYYKVILSSHFLRYLSLNSISQLKYRFYRKYFGHNSRSSDIHPQSFVVQFCHRMSGPGISGKTHTLCQITSGLIFSKKYNIWFSETDVCELYVHHLYW